MKAKSSQLQNEKFVNYAIAGASLLAAGYTLYKELTKFKLENKVVLITGGSRGLGLVLARELGKRGAKLAIAARSVDQLQRAQKELTDAGFEALALAVDVTDLSEVTTMVKDTIDHYGRIDVLINNAGIVQVGPYESMSIEDYENAMKTNFWGPLYAIHAAVPYFKKQRSGRIVNVSSIGGKVAVPHLLPYTASKFALTGFSEGLHAELKKDNIHVTTVIPNLMRTGSPMNITVKGDHEAEYAWFKVSDSSPILSQKAETAAKNIIAALEYGQSEAILTTTAKLSTAAMGLAPGLVSNVLSIANKFLPDNKTGGLRAKKGYQSESNKSRGPVITLTDREAIKNNEY